LVFYPFGMIQSVLLRTCYMISGNIGTLCSVLQAANLLLSVLGTTLDGKSYYYGILITFHFVTAGSGYYNLNL
jgi:hypothetical protein